MEDSFRFGGHGVSLADGKAEFYFTLTHKGVENQFKETISFRPPESGREVSEKLIENLFQNIALALGISYWKLVCPVKIELGKYQLSEPEAHFWTTIYTKGLGEFAYKNNLDLKSKVSFPINKKIQATITYSCRDRSLLFIGGGKDSIVAGELLKNCQKPFDGFALHKIELQDKTAQIMGIPLIAIERVMDPAFFEYQKRDDIYKGHVPVSLFYALIGLLAAILYDYRYLVAANEESANYGNVEYRGEIINHQWSKSAEFEILFRNFIHECITPDITYFSLMRPFTEIKIAEIFSRFTQYFSTFSSCNKNFKLAFDMNAPRWCGACPKCVFVFASLAAFIPKKQVVEIFGKDLFADSALIWLYEELLGVRNFKPFECVGTPEETKLAFLLACERREFAGELAVEMFKRVFGGEFASIRESAKTLLAQKNAATLPDDFARCLHI